MMADRRKADQRYSEEEREELRESVKNLRDERKLSWAEIASKIGASSPSTPRRLYREAGGNPHGLLPGKGGRTVFWEPGDWCDARCIGALPESPCECSCGGDNHAGGGDRAREIVEQLETDPERIENAVRDVEVIYQANLSARADG